MFGNANGLTIMLKSMGVDPEQIKTALIGARDAIMLQVKEINVKLTRIEQKQDAILSALKIPQQTEPRIVLDDAHTLGAGMDTCTCIEGYHSACPVHSKETATDAGNSGNDFNVQ